MKKGGTVEPFSDCFEQNSLKMFCLLTQWRKVCVRLMLESLRMVTPSAKHLHKLEKAARFPSVSNTTSATKTTVVTTTLS